MADLKEYVTVTEAATMLDVDPSQVRRYIRGDGLAQLPAIKIGNQWLIRASDIKMFDKPAVGNPNLKK